MFQSVTEAPDGSLWVLRGNSDAPLCRVTDSLKCFGKADGIPISDIQSVLADGNGGFWLGGQTGGLVHWHAGTSEKYNVGNEIFSLARGPDGSLWVGISGEGPGKGLQQLKDGALKPFVTPTFNGSSFDIGTLMFDHDGNLWVGTVGKRAFSYPWKCGGALSTIPMACPAILCMLFLKTEKGSSGLELQAESTAFAIRQSSRSRRRKDWEQDLPAGILASQRWHDMGSKRRIA